MRRLLLVLALLAPLPGCSLFEAEEAEPPVEGEDTGRVRTEPIERVGRLEIGRTSDGFVLTAFGLAPGAGYGAPTLVARRDGRPGQDGFIEFDFLARPPDPGFQMPVGAEPVRRLRADRLIEERVLAAGLGVRVFSAGNARQIVF